MASLGISSTIPFPLRIVLNYSSDKGMTLPRFCIAQVRVVIFLFYTNKRIDSKRYKTKLLKKIIVINNYFLLKKETAKLLLNCILLCEKIQNKTHLKCN